MHVFVEKGVPGSISMESKRYAEANNHYVEGYDPEQPNNYLMYLDANSLYGWAMCQPLYISFFQLVEGEITED